MNRLGWLLLGCCLSLPVSWAETVPTAGPVDARVRYATYDADEVYRLRGFVGYQIDLEFEAGEVFSGLANYGRALQDDALKSWGGQAANFVAGQKAMAKRAKLNSLATTGSYASSMESQAA